MLLQIYRFDYKSLIFIWDMDIPEIAEKGYTIYTKSECGWCRRAKALLPKAKVINCDTFLEKDRLTFLEVMHGRIGREHKTFPMVFYDGGFVGGYEDTKNFIDFDITKDF